MTIRQKAVAVIVCVCMCMGILTACGSKDPEGVYYGKYKQIDCYLELKDNGICIYSQSNSTGTGSGTWTVEDDVLRINVSNLKYEIYADDLSDKDGFILHGNSNRWHDTYFSRLEE